MIKYFYQKNKKKPLIYEDIYSTNQTNFNLYHHLYSIEKNKIGREKEQKYNLKRVYLSLMKANLKSYNINDNSTINSIFIDLLIKKKKSHFLIQYNEMKISLNQKPLLNRYYSINESKIRLNKLENYYKHYFKFLAKPTLNNMKFNLLTHENGNEKAQLYFNKVYGQKRKDLKIQNEVEGEIIFNTSIKDSIENYSTTITCDSNEQLIYPSEIYKKCKECNKSIKCNNNKKIILRKKSSYNSIFSESINYNKSILHFNDDIDDCESLVNIIKGLKNKNNDEKENRIKDNKNKITELKNDFVKKSSINNNNGYFQKIFSINNYRNSLTNTEKKSIKKKKKVNKSQTLIHNNKNIKINNINTHSKLVSNIIPKNSINKKMIFNNNINKKQNTRKKNLSLNHIFSCRNSSKSSKNYQIFIANNSKNDNIIIENNKFIRTNKKNPTLQNLKHKNVYNASNLNEQINQLKNIKNNLGKKNYFFPY